MTRDHLEAAIWKLLTALTDENITRIEFVDDILAAADRYAAGDSDGVLADRRRVLIAANPVRRT